MDMLERIGEGYLLRKANAVPDQLEKLAKKQLGASPPAAPQAPTKQSESAPSKDAGKDNEIARLRQELARARAPRSPVPAPSVRSVSPRTLPAAPAPPARKDAEPPTARVKSPSTKHRHEEMVRREAKASPKSRRKGSMEIGRENDGRVALIAPGTGRRKQQPAEREPVDRLPLPRVPPSISSATTASSSTTKRHAASHAGHSSVSGTSAAERSLRHPSSEESLPSFHDVEYRERTGDDDYYIVEVIEED